MANNLQEPRQLGLNASFFFGGLAGLLAHAIWPDSSTYWQQHAGAYALAFVAGTSTTRGLVLLNRDIWLQRSLLKNEAPGTDHGSAREATEDELEMRGCFNPSSGNFLGFKYGRAVYSPPDAPFGLYEAPPGAGKDIYFCVGDILHRSMLGQSVFVPDVKTELAPMLAEGLTQHGVEVWSINPSRQFEDICGSVELGLYQALLDAVYGDENGLKDAVGIAQQIAMLHLPEDKGEGSKKYFSAGSRRALSIPPLVYALVDPARCNPTATFEILNDPEKFIRFLKTVQSDLEPEGDNSQLIKHIRSEAGNLLSRAETNPENFGSFLEWATQSILPYNSAGHLADYGARADRNIRDLCERPITTFVMTPHSHLADFESFTSLVNANLLSAIKRNPRKQKLHLCCNEFLNYRFADIASDLEVIRGFGVTANFYIQSFNGLVRKIGKEAAASVNDYCDVKVFAGLNSERAKHVSEMLSETTIARKDYSYRTDDPSHLNISDKRLGRRLMTADEVQAMPRDRAWVFIKGLRPVQVQLAHYGHVDPWSDLVGNNPLEGNPLKGKTMLKINYKKNGK